MKAVKFNFSPDGTNKWMIFLLVVVIQLGVFGYIGWRWHNTSVDGIPYQWQCLPRLEVSSFGTDYIRVVFPEDTTQWLDDTIPEEGQTIYVQISRNTQGIMKLEGASANKPSRGGDYMKATVVAFHDGMVQFKVGFDRYQIAPEHTDGIYNITNHDSVLASVRIKKGDGVIKGIFINGVPLEACSNGAAIEETRKQQHGTTDTASAGKAFDKPRMVEPGMVPPKEE